MRLDRHSVLAASGEGGLEKEGSFVGTEKSNDFDHFAK